MSRATRKIRQRWIIKGTLELCTPTHLSNGDAEFQVDLPLLVDPYDKRPLLTGASLAGALRNYINEYLNNYKLQTDNQSGEKLLLEKIRKDKEGKKTKSQTASLFGAARRDDEGDQSPLIVHDARGQEKAFEIEQRDGVRIDPKTRTAADKAKFDLHLLAAGTKFDLCFELIITEPMLEHLEAIKETLALALHGLQTKQIPLGGRKRRGYGECAASNWQLWQFDLTTAEGLTGWLAYDYLTSHTTPTPSDDILALLPIKLPIDQRERFELDAHFKIDGSVLIRSGFDSDFGPDMAHLESRRWSESKQAYEMVPVLSGTSLAGVIRAQALRIARTVSGNQEHAKRFIYNLFGYSPEEDEQEKYSKTASRVSVRETVIKGGQRLVQNRVAIDRFTGGALESALFTEQPFFGGQANIQLAIKEPANAEIGLLLLVLKDLWTGFVPIGGEASVGRGRLQGQTGTLKDKNGEWTLNNKSEQFVSGGDPAILEGYVDAFVTEMKRGAA